MYVISFTFDCICFLNANLVILFRYILSNSLFDLYCVQLFCSLIFGLYFGYILGSKFQNYTSIRTYLLTLSVTPLHQLIAQLAIFRHIYFTKVSQSANEGIDGTCLPLYAQTAHWWKCLENNTFYYLLTTFHIIM